MLKNISKMEVKVGEKIYQFLCEMDSSLTDVKEALSQFHVHICYVEESIKKQLQEARERESSEELQEAKAE